MSKIIDCTGMIFGRLTVIEFVGIGRNRTAQWQCRCECGTEITASGTLLRLGKIRSCGCLVRDNARTLPHSQRIRHGASRRGALTTEYTIWRSMRNRCAQPSNVGYALYGGRGIKVCERWNASFDAFLEDMGPRPSQRHSLDRANNDGDYEPGNVRWATRAQQANNKRTTRFIEVNGERLSLSAACKRFAPHLSKKTVQSRINLLGWDTAKALNTPVRRRSANVS